MRSTAPKYRAFTLTELLVAVALLAIVMVAVSTIFRSTGEAVSTGIAVMDLNRRFSSVQNSLQADIVGIGPNPFVSGSGMWPVNRAPGPGAGTPPFLLIRAQQGQAYMNRAQWVQADGAAPTAWFRTDFMGFFATNPIYKRQTGGHRVGTNATGQNVWPAVTNMSATATQNAYVWYGHLKLPSGGTYYRPGEGTPNTNANNYFASQWTLGRVAMILAATPNPWSDYTDAVLDGLNNYVVRYIGRDPTVILSPLAENSSDTIGNGAFGSNNIQDGRYDIAATNSAVTWDDYVTLVRDHANVSPTWADNHFGYRFCADPSPDINWSGAIPGGFSTREEYFADKIARSFPVFMPNCVNFAVEFAGDYVAQQTDGTVQGSDQVALDRTDQSTYHLDGIIDFDVRGGTRQIHWYGLPRDTSGDGIAPSGATAYNTGDVTTVEQMRGAAMPFEYSLSANVRYFAWHRDLLYLPQAVVGGPLAGSHPSLAPRLLRITVQMLDPEGRIDEGMTRQFVFPVRYE